MPFLLLKDPGPAFTLHNKPILNTTDMDETEKASKERIHVERIKLYVTLERKFKKNCKKAYALVWGQYTPALQREVKGLDDYDAKAKQKD